MAVGGFAVDGPLAVTGVEGKITVSVVITCIVAASCGLIFGYDIGISGAFCVNYLAVSLMLTFDFN